MAPFAEFILPNIPVLVLSIVDMVASRNIVFPSFLPSFSTMAISLDLPLWVIPICVQLVIWWIERPVAPQAAAASVPEAAAAPALEEAAAAPAPEAAAAPVPEEAAAPAPEEAAAPAPEEAAAAPAPEAAVAPVPEAAAAAAPVPAAAAAAAPAPVDDDAVCTLCMDAPGHRLDLDCKHTFCRGCLQRHTIRQDEVFVRRTYLRGRAINAYKKIRGCPFNRLHVCPIPGCSCVWSEEVRDALRPTAAELKKLRKERADARKAEREQAAAEAAA